MLSVMFSILFAVINIFLAGMVNDNRVMNFIWSMLVFCGALLVILYVEFDFNNMSNHCIYSVVIGVVYSCVLVPIFMMLSKAISNESLEEAQMLYREQDLYKRMFDSLQEGIIVMQDGKATFMNELSNRILSNLTGSKNFF